MPVILYGNSEETFPEADSGKLNLLTLAIEGISDSELNIENCDVKLANDIITWNVFQHFYPNFNVIDVDWNHELTQIIKETYHSKSNSDYFKALCKMVAKLKDGHGVVLNNEIQRYGLPISVDWIENKIVVTNSLSGKIQKGDIIIEIDGKSALNELQEQESLISGSPQLSRFRALNLFSADFSQTDSHLTLIRDGKKLKIVEKRQSLCNIYFNPLYNFGSSSGLVNSEDSIYYLNKDTFDFEKDGVQLEKIKGIIVGPLFDKSLLLPHLIDTTVWSIPLYVPVTSEPDRENTIFLEQRNKIEPETPYISSKVVFLTYPFDISFNETLLSIMDYYKLGTFVGDTTAGTNGDRNIITLMGNYSVMWTGLKVLKHDGSQLQLNGFKPKYPVQRTFKAIKEGRDEYFEKAVEILKEDSNQ